jgi:hypothetical protein
MNSPMSKFMKIHPVELGVYTGIDIRTDRKEDMTKLIGSLRAYAKASNNQRNSVDFC